jgi:hypothetical protein
LDTGSNAHLIRNQIRRTAYKWLLNGRGLARQLKESEGDAFNEDAENGRSFDGSTGQDE